MNGSLTVKNTTNNAVVSGFIGSVEYLKQPTVVSFDDCFNCGFIIGSQDAVVRFVGYVELNTGMDLVISNSTNKGTISGSWNAAGGFVGCISQGTYTVNIYNCTNNGIVTGETYVGGLVGIFLEEHQCGCDHFQLHQQWQSHWEHL